MNAWQRTALTSGLFDDHISEVLQFLASFLQVRLSAPSRTVGWWRAEKRTEALFSVVNTEQHRTRHRMGRTRTDRIDVNTTQQLGHDHTGVYFRRLASHRSAVQLLAYACVVVILLFCYRVYCIPL